MTHLHWRRQTKISPFLLFCAFLVLLLCSPSSVHATPKAPVSSIRLHTVLLDGVAYLSLQELAGMVSGRLRAHPLKKKTELRAGGHTVVLTLLSSVVVIDDVAYRMPLGTRFRDGVIHVPAEAFAGLLAPIFPIPFDLQKALPPAHPTEVSPAPLVNQETPRPEPALPVPAPVAAPRKTARRPAEKRTDWTLQTVVIDPGHGGKDPGAIGPGGIKEKDVVLRVAVRLKPLLEKQLRVKVVLTRKDDTFIPLRKRSQIALDNSGGKLFVSLHCNANKNRRAKGAEVYFLSEAKTAQAAEVARRENAALDLERNGAGDGNEQNSELLKIQHSLLSTAFLKESQDLAALVRAEIAQTMSVLDDRGVKQANFYVMLGTMGDMPSVLVEMGFISNPSEEKQLRSTAFQKKMAEAIYRGIRTFKLRYEQQLSTTRN